MALPTLSSEQRAAALAKAAAARRTRAAWKERLKRGDVTLSEVLEAAGTEETVGRMRVAEVLESLPRVGKARAAALMDRLEIASSRRLRGLGVKQRAALEREFAPSSSSDSPARSRKSNRPTSR